MTIDPITRAFKDELVKIKQASALSEVLKSNAFRIGAPMAAGGVLTLGAVQAKRDHALGRQIRLQQGNQG